MVQIQTRSGTQAERRVVEGWLKVDYVSWVFVGMLFAIIPFLLFGQLGWSLGIAFWPHWAGLWQFIGWSIAALVFYVPMRKFVLRQQKTKSDLSADLEEFIVQEIVVAYCDSSKVRVQGSDEAALLVDLGQGRGLLLHGEYLTQHVTYGASTASDTMPEFFNGLQAPWSFPSDRFVLTRLPKSGRVLGITVHGDYVEPVESELVLPAMEKESAIVEREMTRLGES